MMGNMIRRSILVGGLGLPLTACFDRPWYEENPKQKAFLQDLQALAKPALASNNPLQLEEAVKQSLALATRTGAFVSPQPFLRMALQDTARAWPGIAQKAFAHAESARASRTDGPGYLGAEFTA